MLRLVALGLIAIVLPACADKKDWSSEIIVQVFKPKLLDLPKVKVVATQGTKVGEVVLTGAFQSCTTNQVRIIPNPAGPDVTIVATAEKLSDSATVKPTQATPVRLVLAPALELEPSACAPLVRPDGGIKKRTADSCSVGQECEGGVCVSTVENANPPVPTFQGGYCSADCGTNPSACAADEQCVKFQNANGQSVGSYCLLKCTTGDAGLTPRCRLALYHCTTGDLCYPNK